MGTFRVNSMVQTLVDVKSDFSEYVIPKGSIGRIVECYDKPQGCAVDVPIPDERLVGECRYENVMLAPDQFVVLDEGQIYQLLFRSYNVRQPSSRAEEESAKKTKTAPVGA